jgi:hypothetical protein
MPTGLCSRGLDEGPISRVAKNLWLIPPLLLTCLLSISCLSISSSVTLFSTVVPCNGFSQFTCLALNNYQLVHSHHSHCMMEHGMGSTLIHSIVWLDGFYRSVPVIFSSDGTRTVDDFSCFDRGLCSLVRTTSRCELIVLEREYAASTFIFSLILILFTW